jgi:hypothetical protein
MIRQRGRQKRESEVFYCCKDPAGLGCHRASSTQAGRDALRTRNPVSEERQGNKVGEGVRQTLNATRAFQYGVRDCVREHLDRQVDES